MTLAVAWAALVVGLAFAVWPVVRHRLPEAGVEQALAPATAEALLEEIELDRIGGRLSDEEADRRRAEVMEQRR